MSTSVRAEREIRVDLPTRCAAVEDVHQRVENRRQDGEDDQRREDAGRVELARRRRDQIADTAIAGDQLADDRADQGVRDSDARAGERRAQRVRDDDLEEYLAS